MSAASKLLMGAVGLVLLIVCANLANLLLRRGVIAAKRWPRAPAGATEDERARRSGEDGRMYNRFRPRAQKGNRF